MTIAGIDALCPANNCDFNRVKPGTEEITGQALVAKSAMATGTDLPTSDAMISIGGSECVATGTATQLSCTLTTLPPAGKWFVEVKTSSGLVPTVVKDDDRIVVALIVSAVANLVTDKKANQAGGDTIVITGTGFDPVTLTNNKVTLEDNTVLTVLSVNSEATEIKAKIETAIITPKGTMKVKLEVNSEKKEEMTIEVSSGVNTATKLEPSTVSPVLRTPIVISMDAAVTATFVAADTTVTLVGTNVVWQGVTTPTTYRNLFVMAVDNTDKKRTVTVKYPGAVMKAAGYKILVSTNTEGAFVSKDLVLTVKGEVTEISPTGGSTLGGTLITITGSVFSTDKLDNPVQVGGHNCIVLASTATEIKCRLIELKTVADKDTGVLVVFLKLSSEATCAGDKCKFTWATSDVTTASAAVAWDGTSKAL